MATVFGTINKFNSDYESFTEWVERLKQWFFTNLIDGADRKQKRALFLLLIGTQAYKLVQSLSQNNPTSKSYYELKTLMRRRTQD